MVLSLDKCKKVKKTRAMEKQVYWQQWKPEFVFVKC